MIYLTGILAVFIMLALLPAFYLAGALLGTTLKEHDPLMRGIVFVALGLGIFAYYVVFVATIRLLNPWAVFLFIPASYAIGFRFFREFRVWISSLCFYLFNANNFLERICLTLFSLTVILSLLLCFLPESSGDALTYQLNIPKLFVRQGSNAPIFYDFNSYLPMLMNHLYAAGLLIHNVALAKLFHWSTGFFLSVATMLLIDRYTQRRTLAIFGGLMLWLTPTLYNQVTTTYVDVGAAFFILISFYLFLEGLHHRAFTNVFLAGILFGFAVSAKLLMLPLVVGFGACGLLVLFQAPSKTPYIKAALLFSSGVLIACSYWFIRNLILTGDPAFPYFSPYYLTGGESKPFLGNYLNYGPAKTLLNLILMPWNWTFHPYFMKSGFWFGPFYLIAAPFALWSLRKRESQPYFIASFLGFVVYFFLAHRERYLFSVLPLFLIASTVGMKELLPKSKHLGVQKGINFIGITLAILMTFISMYHYRFQIPVLIGLWDPKAYLQRIERSIPIASWVNEHLPQDSKILILGDNRHYYFDRDLVRETYFDRRTRFLSIKDDKDLLSFFKKQGITHVLKARPVDYVKDPERWTTINQLLGNRELSHERVQVYSRNFRDRRVVYHLFELK